MARTYRQERTDKNVQTRT